MMVCTVSGVAAVDGYIYAKAMGPVEQTAFNFLIVKLSRLSAVQLSSSAALHHSTIFFFSCCTAFVQLVRVLCGPCSILRYTALQNSALNTRAAIYNHSTLPSSRLNGCVGSVSAPPKHPKEHITFKLPTLFYSLSNRVRSYAHTHPTAFL